MWALIDDAHSLPGRAHAASESARGLAARLIVTATRLAATREGLALEAARRCQPEGVRRHRAAAERARQVAEQARRASLPRSRLLDDEPAEPTGPVTATSVRWIGSLL